MNKNIYYEKYFEVSHKDIKSRNKVWKEVARYLQRFIPENASVLDLGAGYCGFINNIRANKKYALDHHEVVKKYVAEDVSVLVQSCTDIPSIGDESLDTVFASNLLEHLDERETKQTLPEAYRVLKSGGAIILLQPNFTYSYKQYFDDYTHKQIFTHVSLSDLLRVFNFTVTHVYPKFLPFSLRSKLPTHPLFTRLYLASPIKPMAGQMLIVAKK